MKNDSDSLEKKIGHIFKNKDLYTEALTHSSYANEKKTGASNERLEFLGDAVLELIITEYLFGKYPQAPEGVLTNLRSIVVCEKSLHRAALDINLGEFLLFGVGETQSGGKNKPSILADAFEALLGAVFLDGGYRSAKKFCFKLLKENIKIAGERERNDNKQILRKVLSRDDILFTIVFEKGPDHEKLFGANAEINGKIVGYGEGKSKKEAEQNAAKNALLAEGVNVL